MDKRKGFTLTELLVSLVIMMILGAIALSFGARWLDSYRLATAARDLKNYMQKTRMSAIKTGKDWAIVVNTAAGTYSICSDPGAGTWVDGDETIELTIDLDSYKGGVTFGSPDGSVSSQVIVFNSRGLAQAGAIYLTNSRGQEFYRVSTTVAGAQRLAKWGGTAWN